jgi:quercetin dioxygenase-like cupin family protein
MIEEIRAVVTSVEADGTSAFEQASALDSAAYPGGNGVERWSVWGTADGGCRLGAATDARVDTPPFPGPGGTRFFVVRLPPGLSGTFHTTETLDYGIVIEGEIILDLGPGGREVLPAGTCIVQRATSHAWRNEAQVPALVAFVMLGADRVS